MDGRICMGGRIYMDGRICIDGRIGELYESAAPKSRDVEPAYNGTVSQAQYL